MLKWHRGLNFFRGRDSCTSFHQSNYLLCCDAWKLSLKKVDVLFARLVLTSSPGQNKKTWIWQVSEHLWYMQTMEKNTCLCRNPAPWHHEPYSYQPPEIQTFHWSKREERNRTRSRDPIHVVGQIWMIRLSRDKDMKYQLHKHGLPQTNTVCTHAPYKQIDCSCHWL